MAYEIPGVYPKISIDPALLGLPGSNRVMAIIGTGSAYYTRSERVVKASGNVDDLDNYATSISSVYDASQSAYTGYVITGGKINWTGASIKPTVGSTYTVVYQYAKTEADLTVKTLSSLSDAIAEYDYARQESDINKRTLSLAAQIAFEAGATSLYAIQIDPTATDVSATPAQYYTAFSTALDKLKATDAKVIVPLYTETSYLQTFMSTKLKEHVALMSGEYYRQYRIGVFGVNETSSVMTPTQAIAVQAAVTSDRIGMAYPGYVKRIFDFGEITLPGCFLAVAIASINVSALYDSAEPLTNKPITSFSFIPTFSLYGTTQLSGAGIIVIKSLDGSYRITEGTSTDRTYITGQELSTWTSIDEVMSGLQIQLEKAYIGRKFTDNVLLGIKASSYTILEQYKFLELITNFQIVSVTRSTENPQKAIVRLKIMPIFATKYVDIFATVTSSIL